MPHSWIEKCMNMFGVAVNVRSFTSESMKQWNTELNAGQNRLGNVKTKQGMFQRDSLSPLQFVMTMILLTLMLRKTNIVYEVKKKGEIINHLLFMDDLKLFTKNEDQMDSLVNAVRIFSEDIKMEFGLSKCGVLIMKRGKIVESDCLCMPDDTMMRNIEESGYKYPGILEADGIKHDEMKELLTKEYIRRVRNVLKLKLNGGNIISAINSRAVSIVRYGAGIIKWTKNELEELDRKTRKLMTMYGAHHPKADVDRLYLKRCDGGRGLIGGEDCVQAEYGRSKEDIQKKHQEEYESKALHGQFQKVIGKVKGSKSWEWLKKGYLKKETENETVTHIVSECQKQTQKEYKQVRHDNVTEVTGSFTDKTLERYRPDITVIEKKTKECLLIDPACPFDTRIEKEEEKCNNYSDLKYEIARMWRMKDVEVIPVVMGALGTAV
ncbi:uncharacterized protein LOC125034100 [Penaeus chinensis]|uniref:uncharacterized protein LOC125034100 n=1 Tax=Penaeus chinensis TaxID=139456 RepID=UPI001FB5F5F7|nr:uncharacterized protein LOC125034100 [Penaeus chinensis]